jgi:hypothetical protein
MIQSLLPESIETLRSLYRAAFATRPNVAASLGQVLDEILTAVWHDAETEGGYTATLEYVDQRMLPLLAGIADLPPEQVDEALERLKDEWAQPRLDCLHPNRD